MEIKEFKFEGLEFKAEDGKNTFEGYASTFGNTDSVGDIVAYGAFSETISKRLPKLLWQHKMDKPIGVIMEMREDAKGLFVKGKVANTALGNDAAELARIGAIDSMSIGYSVVDSEYNAQKSIRTIKQLELYEISFVTFPANEQAKITSAKGELPRTLREFEQFLRDAGYSRKQATSIALSGFKAEGSQRDAGLEALQTTFNNLIERIKS